MHRLSIDEATSWSATIPGVVAAWVEGSVARGDADSYSDLDLHLAILDSDWEAVMGQRRELVGVLGGLIALQEAGDDRSWIMSGVLAPGRWLDLTFELESRVDEGHRTETPVVLFDRSGCTAHATVSKTRVKELLNDHLEALESRAAWLLANDVRISARGDALALSESAHRVIWSITAPALLLGERVLPRPHGDHCRRMSPEARSVVETSLRAAAKGELNSVVRDARACLEQARRSLNQS